MMHNQLRKCVYVCVCVCVTVAYYQYSLLTSEYGVAVFSWILQLVTLYFVRIHTDKY